MRRRTSKKLTNVSAIRRSALKGILRRRTREERQRTKWIHRRTRNKDSSEEGFLKLKLGATKNEEIRRNIGGTQGRRKPPKEKGLVE